MSEYTPITGELRAAMRQWGWVESDGSITFATSPTPPSIDAEKLLTISGSVFDRYCDAIDAVHAQLERENESLKAELDRVLGEQDRDGWMELPKDADGVPIRVGDKLRYVDEDIECAAITPKRVYFWREREMRWTPGINCRHYVSDTWERIIEDAFDAAIQGADERWDSDVDRDILVARCKALCERTREDE